MKQGTPHNSRAVNAAAAITAVTIVVCAVDVTATFSHLAEHGAASGVTWILASGMTLGTTVVGILALVIFLAGRFGRNQPNAPAITWARAMILAAPFGTIMTLGILDLLSGSWVRNQSWSSLARIAGILGGIGFPWLVARSLLIHTRSMTANPSGRSDGRHPLIVMLMLAAILLFGWMDHVLFPRLYPVFHALLAASMLLLAALVGGFLSGLWPFPRPRKSSDAVILLGTLLCGASLTGHIPGDGLFGRDLLMSRAPLSSRLLPWITPDPEVTGAIIPEEIWNEVTAITPTDPARIRTAFPEHLEGNLLLVTIDAARADHMGFHGYPRPTSPALDAFAQESTVFESAWSQHPSSTLSMASMFKGLYPTSTDVFRNRLKGDWDAASLGDPTLAQRLGDSGWDTAAVTAFPKDFMARSVSFVPQGFASYRNLPELDERSGERVTAAALERLSSLNGRWFLWIHLFDPHAPYLSHDGINLGDGPVDLYDSNIRYADTQVARILAAARAREDWNRTVVVVHSDHGEEFSDHGGTGHHSSVYEEQIRVPLVIRVPGAATRRAVSHPVELMDLKPTILELFDLEPPVKCHGRSLLPLLLPTPGVMPPPVAFTQFRDRAAGTVLLDAVRHKHWKLIHNLNAETYRLFDLGADPHEKDDLVFQRPDQLALMKSYLAACQKQARGEGAPVPGGKDILLEQAYNGDPTRRLEAIDALERRGSLREAADALIQLLGDDASHATKNAAMDSLALYPVTQTPQVLLDLLKNGDPALLPRTISTLGFLGSHSSVKHLAPLLQHDEQEIATAATIAAAMCGGGGLVPQMEELASSGEGATRLASLLGLARLGDAGALQATSVLAEWPTTPIDWFTRTSRTTSRARDARLLVAWYIRLLLPPSQPLAIAAVVDGIFEYPHAVAAPVLRRLLVHPDPAMRKRIEEKLASAELSAWGGGLREVEMLMRVGRDQAPAGNWQEAAQASVTAFERGRALGFIDWGIALEGWFFLATAGHHQQGIDLVQNCISSTQELPTMAGEILKRAQELSRTATGTPHVTMEVADVDSDLVPGHWPFCIRVRIRTQNASLRGGASRISPQILVGIYDPKDPAKRHVSYLPIPILGVLPGETLDLVLPIVVPALSSGQWEVSVAVTHQGKFLSTPVTAGRFTVQ